MNYLALIEGYLRHESDSDNYHKLPTIKEDGSLIDKNPSLEAMAEIFSMGAVTETQFKNMETLHNAGLSGLYWKSVRCAEELSHLLQGADDLLRLRVTSEVIQQCQTEYGDGPEIPLPDYQFHQVSSDMMKIVEKQRHSRESLHFLLREFPYIAVSGVKPHPNRDDAVRAANLLS